MVDKALDDGSRFAGARGGVGATAWAGGGAAVRLWAQDWGYGAGLARAVAGLAGRRLVVVVMVMVGWGAEQAGGHVGGPGGVGWRGRGRGATVSGRGRLVVHGRRRLVVRGGHGERQGSRRGGGGQVGGGEG